MKNKLKFASIAILLFILLAICFLISFYIVSPFSNFVYSSLIVKECLIVSMIGIFLFIILLVIWYHLIKRNHSHHNFYYDIQKALDRITKGDFKVTIDMTQYHNSHLSELAEKVNVMAQELSGMETMRQDFVSNVSHEIQSPLTSIRGFVSLLRSENLSKYKRLHYIDIIETESLRLSKLSDNLLKLSTLDSEYTSFQPKAYSIDKQIKDAILMLEPQWSAKSIDISVEDEPVNVVADEELLSQIWINLLNNSIKFTPEGGKICVSISKKEKDVKVTISDNGIGMTTENLTHIFERFYKVDKSRSCGTGGSGLGLSIVKRIVEIHYGSIEVESYPNKGTVFNIKIPIKNLR